MSWRLNFTKGDGWGEPVSYLIAYAMFALMFGFRDVIAGFSARLRRSFAGLADISYSLYVVHGILGYTIVAVMLNAGFGAASATIAAITAALGTAIVLHVTVEHTSRIFGKPLAARHSNTAATVLLH